MNPLKPVNSTTTFFAGKEPEEKTNEVARLRAENEKLTDLFEYYYNCFDEADCERMDLEEEVARLHHLLEWAETLLCNAEPPRHSDHAEWLGIVHKWRDQKHGIAPLPVQEEMPLDTLWTQVLLHRKEKNGDMADAFRSIYECLRYLRDEVQKLKATVNKTTPNS